MKIYKIIQVDFKKFKQYSPIFKKNLIMYTFPKKNYLLMKQLFLGIEKLSFRTYNPANLTKYGILVRVVCKARSGYICKYGTKMMWK